VNGEDVLIEVLPVQAIVNGTAVTAVRIDQLRKEHRRQKRNIDKETIKFRKTHQKEVKLSVRVKKSSVGHRLRQRHSFNLQ